MTGSKSPQTVRNIVIVVLALWSVISLIIIVVWATSPDMKSASQCRAELQEARVKLEGARVVWAKDKAALEEIVHEEREARSRQRDQIQGLLLRLAAANASLDECRQETVVLWGNVTVLEQQVELHRQTEANLTAHIALQRDHIEVLQQNMTQAFHQTQSCFSLNAAAESQMQAAQSQTKACQSSKQYLEKQLLKCKVVDQQASDQQASDQQTEGNGAAPHAGVPALLLLLLCTGLRLIT
ncbi:centriolin [Centroberyx affinis]|uniref:centriolin n=1 Tax=Centroberyx affinis TaxID=166261 RepID=UPI003A5C2330